MQGWKEEAGEMFFQGHMAINQISEKLGVSRQSISAHLKSVPGFREEKEARKLANGIRRREYKRGKNQEYRADRKGSGLTGGITAETIRREHDLAALELSRERYH